MFVSTYSVLGVFSLRILFIFSRVFSSGVKRGNFRNDANEATKGSIVAKFALSFRQYPFLHIFI